jgi:hypothetical protein
MCVLAQMRPAMIKKLKGGFSYCLGCCEFALRAETLTFGR